MEKCNKIGVVILAAGQGKRLGCSDIPKVMLEIGGRPIVSYVVEVLNGLGFSKENICMVVGFQKDRVREHFKDLVSYVHQEEQLGTAHAAYIGMKELPDQVSQVLVVQGDDSAFYTKDTIINFLNKHEVERAVLSLLTTEVEDPSTLGRVVRSNNSDIVGVVEKEEVEDRHEKIKEVSTGTYCFDRQWFENIFPNMSKIEGLGEYGLPQAIKIANNDSQSIQAIRLEDSSEWFGVNTKEELEEADRRKRDKIK